MRIDAHREASLIEGAASLLQDMAAILKDKDAAPERHIAGMDEQEFRSLYDATGRPILAYLVGITGRRDVADDVLQETYCRYFVRYTESEKTRGMDANETRRYLFRIATNLLRDRWRSGMDAQVIESQIAEIAGGSTDVDTQLEVRQAMQALKPRERELLWLAYVEGMNHAEIAAATGLGAMSIRILLFRARRKAASLLRPQKETA